MFKLRSKLQHTYYTLLSQHILNAM